MIGHGLGIKPCPRCGEPLGGRYLHRGEWVCWPCTGYELERPPARRAGGMARATRELIDRLERALGRAVCTPEWVMAADHRQTGRLERAGYRVWRWRCPACHGGGDDPLQIYRPFVVDSNGRMFCEAPGCRDSELRATLRRLIGDKS